MLDDDLFLVNSLDKALLVLVVELVRFDENEYSYLVSQGVEVDISNL